jgi:hypothetical protein
MKEKYKLSEIAEKRLEESNLKIDQDNSKLSRIGEMALYSTVPDKNSEEVRLDSINSDKLNKIEKIVQDDNEFDRFKRQTNLTRLCNINNKLPRMLSLGHDDFHVFGVDLIDRDRVGVLIKHEETEDNNIKLDVNFTNYKYALIKKDNVCDGRLNDIDFDKKIVFEEYNYLKHFENIENSKHIVTQKFKSYDKSSDSYLQGHFRLDVDDFASFTKVVSKEDFERQCLDGTLFDNEINAFLENSFVEEHKDLIESFKNQQVNRHALDEFLLEQDLIDNDLYRNVVNYGEQAFIDAVSSVTSKEQDKGLIR